MRTSSSPQLASTPLDKVDPKVSCIRTTYISSLSTSTHGYHLFNNVHIQQNNNNRQLLARVRHTSLLSGASWVQSGATSSRHSAPRSPLQPEYLEGHGQRVGKARVAADVERAASIFAVRSAERGQQLSQQKRARR